MDACAAPVGRLSMRWRARRLWCACSPWPQRLRAGGRLTPVDGRGARSEPRSDETDLAFEGLCTFADPPKATAPAAVARLAAAGVRVVIRSGDDPLVVGRLAKIVGFAPSRPSSGPTCMCCRPTPSGCRRATPTSSPGSLPTRKSGSSMRYATPARLSGSWATGSTTRRASRLRTSDCRWTALRASPGRRRI